MPTELRDVLWLGPMKGSIGTLSGGVAEAGLIYPGPDGNRLYYGNYANDVVYLLVEANPGYEGNAGKFFSQPRSGFQSDITFGGTAAGVTERTKGTKSVIEGFLDVYMGVLSCAGGPLALGITGMNVLVATGKIVKNYDTYKKAIEVLLYNRDFIRQNAPTFYYVVFSEALLGFYEQMLTGKAKEALAGAVPGPKIVGKVVGVFIGKIGEDKFKVRLKAVNDLFKEVLIKVADHAAKMWPKKLSDDQVSSLARHHVTRILNAPGLLNIDQKTAEMIVREVADNCLGMQGPLKKMSAALDAIG